MDLFSRRVRVKFVLRHFGDRSFRPQHAHADRDRAGEHCQPGIFEPQHRRRTDGKRISTVSGPSERHAYFYSHSYRDGNAYIHSNENKNTNAVRPVHNPNKSARTAKTAGQIAYSHTYSDHHFDDHRHGDSTRAANRYASAGTVKHASASNFNLNALI